ncbi:MAG TPA: helix-turn-helix domain-containing protein [Alphaproteobacteria bacterium]|nr:helix-turn-helix domain-containing protein [Alphaproteobacteria bacterium]
MTALHKTPGGLRLRTLREQAGKTQLAVEVEADLGSGYLQRIETGKVIHPQRPTLERILAALEARYGERREVLELFGYMVTTPLPSEEEVDWACALSHSGLHSVVFPAYILDCAHRLLAWNRYVPKLFGVAPQAMASWARACMLDLWLNPRHGLTTLVDNPDTFFPAMVRALRHEMQPFRHEEWCVELIARLLRELPLFKKYWTVVEHAGMHAIAARAVVPMRLEVPGVGLLQFRLSAEHFTRDARFRIVYYLPADACTMQQCAVWADLIAADV